MEIGLVLPHTGPRASAGFIRDFAQTAETHGIDSLWAVDHLVLPQHTDSPYVLGRSPAPVDDGWLPANLAPNYEMVTTLTWVAAQTTTIGLGTSVAVLPIRNAVANARQLATLDEFSGGRLTYGVGIGWLREEAEAMGMPWDRRGRRSEEHIALLRALWTAEGPLVEFHGEFHDIPPIDPRPLPRRRPIPILVGGHSAAALARAARIGDGWISAPMSARRLGEQLTALHRAAQAVDRDPDSLRVVGATSVPDLDVPGGDDRMLDTLDEFAALGVDHLQLLIPVDERAEALETIGRIGAIRRRQVRSDT